MDNTLEDLVNRNILPNDELLLSEIDLGCHQANSFLTVVNFSTPGYEYVGSTCHTVTGYSAETFLKGGPQFVFSIASEETALSIMQNQVAFSRQAKAPGFDPRTMRIHEQQVDIRSGFGYQKRLIILGLPLTYTTQADMEFGIAINTEENDELIKTCKQLLVRIKERHNVVYRHVAFQHKPEPLPKLFVQKRTPQNLTAREEEVLKLLAKGFTSKQIGAAIFIEETTVETHRKHLFQKFGTKNIAELIKKASKQYWLE